MPSSFLIIQNHGINLLFRCLMRGRVCRLQARARKPISRGCGRCYRGTAMGMGTRSVQVGYRHEAYRRRRFIQACCSGKEYSQTLTGATRSGGNLAAVLTHKAVQLYPPIPLVFQLLIVPVTDNTASASGVPHASWRENRHTPWLTPARMLWFRRQYLPQESTWARWDASPLLAQEEMFRRVPKAWIAVTELDVLRDEGISYGKKLLKAGVPTEIKTYQAAPHPIMAMDGTYYFVCDTAIIPLCAQHAYYSVFRVSRCDFIGGNIQAYNFAKCVTHRKAIGLGCCSSSCPGIWSSKTRPKSVRKRSRVMRVSDVCDVPQILIIIWAEYERGEAAQYINLSKMAQSLP